MADNKKSKTKWTVDYDKGLLKCKLPLGTNAQFSVLDILTHDKGLEGKKIWAAADQTTKMALFYGVKQKLSDTLAGTKVDEKGKITLMMSAFKRITRERLWNEKASGGGGIAKSALETKLDELRTQRDAAKDKGTKAALQVAIDTIKPLLVKK